MNKPARSFAKPLRDVVGKIVGETFTRQGFASAELVTRWTEIVGPEIAAHSEPIKIQWQRPAPSHPSRASGGGMGWEQEPGTLVLRVEGPAAIEIQHLANVICDRVNRFLGWRDRRARRATPGAAAPRASARPRRPAIPPPRRASPRPCRKSPTTILSRRWRDSGRPSKGAESGGAIQRCRRGLARGHANATLVPQEFCAFAGISPVKLGASLVAHSSQIVHRRRGLRPRRSRTFRCAASAPHRPGQSGPARGTPAPAPAPLPPPIPQNSPNWPSPDPPATSCSAPTRRR